jgi:hypothetical protein
VAAGALTQDQAKRRLREILKSATAAVSFTGHALKEMTADRMTAVDVVNVLRGGWADPAEWENGEWRYRIHTRTMCVVVSFPADDKVRVITAWRER